MTASNLLERAPAPALVAVGAVSVQLGAAVATRLFDRVGPVGAVTLRLVFAAVVLVVLVRPRPAAVRGPAGRRGDPVVVVAFGLLLAGMNLLFYSAIARVPLGVAVTVEFVGPLAVTIGGSRRRLDLLWALLAATGVLLLAGSGLVSEPGRHVDPVGIVMALGAGACWAGYILLSAQTGRRFPGSSGLALAMVVGAAATLPAGLAAAGARLLEPAVLGMGVGVAIL
ncbi:MAG: EamA family transporter, partial [Acidimicrobiales bacterium]